MMKKRLFDLAFAAVVLVMLLPVLLALGLWVKLDSPGPVFFRQVRVGRRGALFRIFKLRTMSDESEDHSSQITIGHDLRITQSGRFLRRHKLDELPQFLNVLLGEMSVVGPRPEVPRYVAMYPPGVRDAVLSVRPGITDLASLAYRDESSLLAQSVHPEREYVEVLMPAKLRYAVEYVQQRTMLLDLQIIWRTVVEVFAPRKST